MKKSLVLILGLIILVGISCKKQPKKRASKGKKQTPTTVVLEGAQIEVDWANIHRAMGGSIFAKFPRSTPVEILRRGPRWSEIRLPREKLMGWILSSDITKATDAEARLARMSKKAPEAVTGNVKEKRTLAQARVRWNRVNMRDASVQGKKIGVLRKGTRLEIRERKGKWVRVGVAGGDREGWIVSKAIRLIRTKKPEVEKESPADDSTVDDSSKVVQVSAKKYVNLRRAPSTRSRKRGRLARGTQLKIIQRKGKWAKVRVVKTGRTGWVAVKFTAPDGTIGPSDSPAPPAMKSGRRVRRIIWDNVNVRQAPRGQILGRFRKGTSVRILAKSGDWYKVKQVKGDITGWVTQKAVGR